MAKVHFCIISVLLCGIEIILNSSLYSQDKLFSHIARIPEKVYHKDTKTDSSFGATEKISSLVMGGFFGFWIGAGIGASFARPGYDRVGGALIGGGIGVTVGAAVNYFIISKLARGHSINKNQTATGSNVKNTTMTFSFASNADHVSDARLFLTIMF